MFARDIKIEVIDLQRKNNKNAEDNNIIRLMMLT